MNLTSDSPLIEIVSEYIIKDQSNINELNLILDKLTNDKDAFQNLLNNLETFLVNTNDIFRKNSVKLISFVLEKIKSLHLDEKEIKKLLEFSFSKMKDVVCAPFAVRIIYFLLINQFQNKFIIDGDFTNFLVDSLLLNFNYEKFHIPSYYQETRYFSLKILDFMITKLNCNKLFQNKMIEYITIVLDALDGEKDPRNILIMFYLIKEINSKCQKDLLKIYSKNFFEILDVYYPIEFVPPKNSPDKITAEDLINGLNEAFASCEYYMEYILEEIRDKLSSSQIETKIQVLKTIRLINKKYPIEIIKQYFITILNLILHQILNNEDEYLHIEAIITFKEMIKRYSDEFTSNENLNDTDDHIINNLNKIYENCEDLMFNTENSKNAFDAKDLIVVLVEYGNIHNLNFRERAFRLSLKLINNYLETKKFNYLKNSNSILFFTLKENYNLHLNLKNYIESNQNLIRNLIFNLIKKFSNESEEIETIIDITACFIVKTDNIFNKNEISELFNKIFNTWRECEHSIENHLGICINEIISKYEELNNLDFVINLIESQLKEIFNNNDTNGNFSDLGKYLNILQHYFSNHKLSKFILEFVLNLFYKVFTSMDNINLEKRNYLEVLLTRLSNLILNIFDKKEEIILIENNKICKFIEDLLTSNKIILGTSNSVFNDIKNILRAVLKEFNCERILFFIVEIDDVKKVIDSNYSYMLLYQKVIKYIIKRIPNLNSQIYLKLIPYLLFEISNWFSKIYEIEKDLNIEKIIKIFTKISENTGISYFNININKIENLSKISDSIKELFLNNFEELKMNLVNNKEIEDKDNKNNLLQFKLHLIFTSFIFNYSILLNCDYAFEQTKSLLNLFSNINSYQMYTILENSPLFKFDKIIFNNENFDKSPIYTLLSILKDVHQKFQRENLNFPKNITTTLLLNIYSRFDDNYIEENSDIVMNLCVKALEEGINLKVSSEMIKKGLKSIDRDFVRRKGYDVKRIVDSMIGIMEKTDDIQIKINLLSCIYKFRYVIQNWDDKFVKHVK